MNIIQTIFAFIISLGILVSIHEWGHFWVARKMGVKILRFSIGFGRPLLTWHDKQGTEFVLALIPLGGYVKMLDEREGDVPESSLHMTFNRKNVWARIAIVIAGPVANFILAVVALWLMYLIGIKTIVPTIGRVIPSSPAAKADLTANARIVAIDGKTVKSWNDINLALATHIGESAPFPVTTQLPTGEQTHMVSIQQWPRSLEHQSLLEILGVETWFPTVPSVIGKVIPGLPADKAGLKQNDKILTINDQPVHDWSAMVKMVRSHPNVPLHFEILRNRQTVSLTITPEKQVQGDAMTGFIGAEVKPVHWPDNQIVNLSYNPVTALSVAISETISLAHMTIHSLIKLITGILSLNNLSGPITIAKVAGESLRSGFESFLYFIAMLSVSLGVINLLPVPALDGGHLFYFLIEAVRGRPVSQKIQTFGLQLGIIIVLCVMLLALYNDFSRL